MKNTNPAEYYRNNKNWSVLLGKVGSVVQSTRLNVSAPEHEKFLPYEFLIVDVAQDNQKKERIEVMGVCGKHFEPGDRVKLVFKKIAEPSQNGVIPYGVKADLVVDIKK